MKTATHAQQLNFEAEFTALRTFFDAGNTRSYAYRIKQLKRLKATLVELEDEILEALHKDMHKPEFEAFASEIGLVYDELKYIMRNLKRWMRPQKTGTPLALHPSKSITYPEPLGIVLIIAPWNYPFQLILSPLIGAIAAGNCAVLKPSEHTPHTTAIIEKIIKKTFPPEYINVIQGLGHEVGPYLIENFRFDHIFFTGSLPVGKKIMESATKQFTPVTLELGGKSPAVVDKEVNLEVAARRIAWAKCFNAGQTCVAPDYILVHHSQKKALVEALSKHINSFFKGDPLKSPDYTHLVNKKRFDTLSSYLKDCNILYGGESAPEINCIAPTIVDGVDFDHPLMQEEIFGPILPVLTWDKLPEVLEIVRKNRYPLAFYIYTKNKTTEKFLLERVQFGGGAVNNSLAHLANPKLRFGGVGYSGMGNYHGKYSFDCLTHYKSVLKTSTFLDPKLRYAPYTKTKLKWLRKLFR